ncbi:hypothetical protein D307_gp101 [Bacillus phage Bastille]|uniref:DUF5678 domain-containing protein n=3 Tax=Bastillevirus TaxID=1918010 RepID=A0A024B196_9CAUD|nr:hypothetical protein D307_gp101 [Bacillus phage Bastille]YP_009035758.1 hypothetical protein FP76_gp133 [Bacillus phage Evoli]AEQ34363.1 hypothetical protein [Bacillus phage Bastille]AHZ09961.1 hypothetical protein [Bacillus phage Evoli]AMW61990.1 hypothetical protein DNAM5_246 [Bacillus phage Vinny]
MDITKEQLEEYKSHKWFACQMDDGFVASANTLKELLEKFGRTSATHMFKGVYEFKDYAENYGWTVSIYKGADLAKQMGGFIIDDDEWNTWHKNY